MCYKQPIIPDQKDVNAIFRIPEGSSIPEIKEVLKRVRYWEILQVGKDFFLIAKMGIESFGKIQENLEQRIECKLVSQVGENGYKQMREFLDAEFAKAQKEFESCAKELRTGNINIYRIKESLEDFEKKVKKEKHGGGDSFYIGDVMYFRCSPKEEIADENWELINKIDKNSKIDGKRRAIKNRLTKDFLKFLENTCPKLAIV